jgi:hypothetical protein
VVHLVRWVADLSREVVRIGGDLLGCCTRLRAWLLIQADFVNMTITAIGNDCSRVLTVERWTILLLIRDGGLRAMKALRSRGVIAGSTRIRVRRSEGGHLPASKVVVTTLVYEAVWTWVVSWRQWRSHGGEAIRHILSVDAIGLVRAMTSSTMLRTLLVWIGRNVASGLRRSRR